MISSAIFFHISNFLLYFDFLLPLLQLLMFPSILLRSSFHPTLVHRSLSSLSNFRSRIFLRKFSSPPASISLVYENPFVSALKRLKMLSIGSSFLSIVSAPVLIVLADGSLLKSLVVAGSTIFFSLGSTFGIYFFNRTQAMKIYRISSCVESSENEEIDNFNNQMSLPQFNSSEYCVEMQNLFGRATFSTIEISSLQAVTRLAANCTAIRTDEFAGKEMGIYLHPAGILDKELKETLKIEEMTEENENSEVEKKS